jgi:photosynthetic reaction center cytochrome c subunit
MIEKDKGGELRSIGQPLGLRSGQPSVAVPAFRLLLALVFCGALIGAKAQSGAPAQPATDPQHKTAVQQFKNIQVLKDIPADQLIPAMQFVAASLGVECEFCHVPNAFEKDDKKPKKIARSMMAMMLTIDQENFDANLAVTCYTCHRGSIHPIATPLVMGEQPTETAQAGESNGAEAGGEIKEVGGPSADDLIEKYLKAVGGVAAVNKTTSRVMKGTITFGDSKVPIEIYAKAPDMRVSITHTPDGDSVTTFDGHQGWLGFPGHPVHDMHGPDIDGASMDADIHFPAHLKDMFSKTEVQGTQKIDGREAYLVIGERAGKTPLHLYFDRESGLLVRLVRYGQTPLGQLPTQLDYADYKDARGVKIPFRWTLARPGGRFTIQINEVQVNVPVDDAKFAKPAGPKGQK